MILFDVNVLLNAHRPAQDHHDVARGLLEDVVNASEPFALSELVLSSFVRIATNPRAFAVPTPLDEPFRFADSFSSGGTRESFGPAAAIGRYSTAPKPAAA